jgi:hypothetical protein
MRSEAFLLPTSFPVYVTHIFHKGGAAMGRILVGVRHSQQLVEAFIQCLIAVPTLKFATSLFHIAWHLL